MIETFHADLPHGITLSCRASGPRGAPLVILLHGFPEADLPEAPSDDREDLVLALVGVLAQRERHVVQQVHRAEERAVLEQDAELLPHLEELVVAHRRHRLHVLDDDAVVRVE